MMSTSPLVDKGNEITAMDAVALSRAIRERRVSCREVMTAFLERIALYNGDYNAIVSLQDPEHLLRRAEERDEQLARGHYLGWMHGFPQAPKDLALTAGIPTTLGSPILKDNVPVQDAIIVERIKRCGAIIIGKTNTSEFGLGSHTYNTVFGTTLNAYDRTKTAGGSSGGAAVALALHLLPVADGSDMMGSLRNPAAYNAVYGFRPSFGRVPYGPAYEVFYQQLSTEGPMARNVTDLAMLLSVQAGYDPRAPLSLPEDPEIFTRPLDRDFRDVRVAWLGDWDGYLAMEPGVLDVCRRSLQTLETIGCHVEEARPAFSPAELWQTWLTLRGFLFAGVADPFYRDPAWRAMMKPEAVWEVENGRRLTGEEIYKASLSRTSWYFAVMEMFKKYEYLVLPSAQVFPFAAEIPWPQE
ncbi:MAG: amidase, partial [Syntrophales bacterium]|nr:amidase [Syntrophales bacterium]